MKSSISSFWFGCACISACIGVVNANANANANAKRNTHVNSHLYDFQARNRDT